MEQTPIDLLAIGKGGAHHGFLEILKANSERPNKYTKVKSTVEIPFKAALPTTMMLGKGKLASTVGILGTGAAVVGGGYLAEEAETIDNKAKGLNNPEYGLVVITFLKPLDERLYDVLKEKQEIIFVENNYSGQLENYICGQFGLKFIEGLQISHLRKYDLFPFYIEDFNSLI